MRFVDKTPPYPLFCARSGDLNSDDAQVRVPNRVFVDAQPRLLGPYPIRSGLDVAPIDLQPVGSLARAVAILRSETGYRVRP